MKTKHIHQYRMAKRKGEALKAPLDRLFLCAKNDCGYQAKGYQIEGKIARCNNCGNSLELTRDALSRANVICRACIGKKGSLNVEVRSKPSTAASKSLVDRLFAKEVDYVSVLENPDEVNKHLETFFGEERNENE